MAEGFKNYVNHLSSFYGKAVCCGCPDKQTGIKCQNKTGSYMDYSYFIHNNYAWIGGLLALGILVVAVAMIVALFPRRKR